MGRLAGVFVLLLTLAACGRELTPEEQALEDERDIAMVERANGTAAPLQEVVPQPISYADIERYDLFGAACNYAPGTSLGTRVVAREADAFVKIDGEVMRFAADPGSRELPLRSRSLYNGKGHVLQLQIEGEGKPSGEETVDYEGRVTLRDPYGRVVYEGSGLAQCGS